MGTRRRVSKPERLAAEDPSFQRNLERALTMSLYTKDAPPCKRATFSQSVDVEKRRRDPDSGSECVVMEATDYLGVERSAATGLYRASIKRARAHPHVFGWYATSIEAAAAYDEMARRVHGPEAPTNLEKPEGLPLFAAPPPANWKLGDDDWKPRRPTWYEALVARSLEARGFIEKPPPEKSAAKPSRRRSTATIPRSRAAAPPAKNRLQRGCSSSSSSTPVPSEADTTSIEDPPRPKKKKKSSSSSLS